MNFSKLWEKETAPNPAVIEFTSGKDRQTDVALAGWDIVGSMAHVIMLGEVNLISGSEKHDLLEALNKLFVKFLCGELLLVEGV